MTSPRLRHLSEDECLRLLASERLGRVGITIGALPAILPVNYALLGRDVVFRTGPGTKLSAATMGTIVSFEVDGVSADHASGWSVVVVGHASEIRDQSIREEAKALPLQTWAPGRRDHYVRIVNEHTSGRAFGSV